MIEALLAESGLAPSQLRGIAFGAGPGSFTGLRIACGVAQGLALGADLLLVGVSTLEAMAETLRRRDGSDKVVAALDARMGEIYIAAYHHDGSRWHERIAGRAQATASRCSMPCANDLSDGTPTFCRAPPRSARCRSRDSKRARAWPRVTRIRSTFAIASR
jgi:tRNA threonylcarbamoyladenosine biosynthesis protein TsaB